MGMAPRRSASRTRRAAVATPARPDLIRNGTAPQQASENAFKKVEAILARHPIVQS